MAQEKLPIKDILAAIDMGAKSVWKELSDEQKKQVSFWLLNRYVSTVQGSQEKQQLAIFKTNEYYNKNYMEVSKHPELQWQLLCMSGATEKIEYHPWIGFKKKTSNNKRLKILQEIYPNTKEDELELLASISTKKDIQELAEEHGYDKKVLKDIK